MKSKKKDAFLQAASEEEIFDYAKSVINAHLLEKSFKQMLKDSYLNHFGLIYPLTLQKYKTGTCMLKRKEYVQFLLDKHKNVLNMKIFIILKLQFFK